MKKSDTRRMSVVVAAIVMLASMSAASAGAKSRSFTATLEGNANPVPTADPCVLQNTESGTAKATHLGRSAWVSSETVDLCSNPQGAEVRGGLILTAANGDQVFVQYQTLAHLDPQNARLTFSGRYEVVGGTGRFEDAYGEGELSGSGSLLPPFAVTATMSGHIFY